ncbi:MAG: glycine/D-amino acid oxidase-like deaminating enzyme [Urechidicola sp.]|jgi:glycine/D-amino acid oxidase-like deaminating enzyme
MVDVIQSPPDQGVSGWAAILLNREPHSPLEDDIEADYLIVGAGFAGLTAARRLMHLDPTAKVVIVEACQVAEGPSGRNSGFMIDLPHVLSSNSYAGVLDHDRSDIRMNRAAISFAKSMVDEFKLSKAVFDLCGKWNAAATKGGLKQNASYSAHLDSLNEPYEFFNAAQMYELTGSNYYQGGLWTPGTAIFQPVQYIAGIADALANLPLCKLYEKTPVVSLNKVADQWIAKTSRGSIRANKVILAVNGLIENFGFYERRLMHINLYASMTRALKIDEINRLGGADAWAFTPADPLGSTVRRINGAGGHRLLVRNRCTYDPTLTLPSDRLSKIAADHNRSFYRRFPMLKDVSMEYRWSGRLCLSRNNVWAIGEVAEGLFSACCQNGLGATKGTIAGVVAAEKASGKIADSQIPDFVQQDLPKKLLPEPLMTLGARGYLKFREFCAGKEL